MRPPICHVCNLSMHDRAPMTRFELVQFGLTAEEEAERKGHEGTGWVGHPVGLEWFCDEHVPLAQRQAHLHWREALELLADSAPKRIAVTPRICYVCGLPPREGASPEASGAVGFALSRRERAARSGRSSPAPGPEWKWFCADHVQAARALSRVNWRTALVLLRLRRGPFRWGRRFVTPRGGSS